MHELLTKYNQRSLVQAKQLARYMYFKKQPHLYSAISIIQTSVRIIFIFYISDSSEGEKEILCLTPKMNCKVSIKRHLEPTSKYGYIFFTLVHGMKLYIYTDINSIY